MDGIAKEELEDVEVNEMEGVHPRVEHSVEDERWRVEELVPVPLPLILISPHLLMCILPSLLSLIP